MAISMTEDLFRELETERLILRKIHEEDAVDLYENIYNNFNWYKFCDQTSYGSLYEYSILVRAQEYFYKEGNYLRWGLEDKESGAVIGDISIHSEDNLNNNCQIGYIVSYNHHSRGYATEAVSKIINFAFNEANFHKIQAAIVSENVPSLRVAKKVGMQYEGTMIESYRLGDKYYNQDIYYMINPKDKPKQKIK